MGAMCSSGSNADVASNSVNKATSNELQRGVVRERTNEKTIKKLLLLGSGNSGKSTFFKQLVQIHGEGFNEKHIIDATKSIYDCVILQMKNVIQQSKQFNYNFENNNSILSDMKHIAELPPNSEVNQRVANSIENLWKTKEMKDTFYNRTNLGIVDSANYFFDNIQRIAEDDYIPSAQDILLVRTPTTGIVKSQFEIESHRFEIFDVGGQRSERNKWIHCFSTVTAVIFVASLSCFDQGLYEQEHVNAMHESLLLFDEIINSRWFKGTSMILFLNKSDLFEVKIKKKSLKICFPEYDGDNSYNNAISYIKQQFTDVSPKNSARQIYAHVTCATNEQDVIRVFKDVQHIAVAGSLQRGGLI